jgi:hypothetical protein
MNIFTIKTIKIRSYEMGLYFRDGEFKGLLREGRHWFVDPLGKVKVEVVSQRTPWLAQDKLDVIVRSGALNQFDDNYFGALMDVKPGRYTGGYTQDPKTGGGFEQNFAKIPDSPYVKLKYLPKNLAAQQARMGVFNPDVNASDAGMFAMSKDEVQAFSAEADAAIPVGTVLPSVVFDKPFEGDRGDVSAHAVWKEGWWTLEAGRVLNTGSAFDQPIVNDMFMWVGVFDHNQVRHTRHVQPMRLKLQ